MGSGDAYNLLGCIEYKGFKVKRDYEQARQLFLQAERLGNPAALNNLAWLYQHGYGVPQDLAKAVHYYTQSVATGLLQRPVQPGLPVFSRPGRRAGSCQSLRAVPTAPWTRRTPPPCSTWHCCSWIRTPATAMYARAASLLKKCALAGIAEARDLLAELHLRRSAPCLS